MTEKTWTPLDLIKTTAAYLAEKEVPGARLDAEILLARVLGMSRIELYTEADRALTDEELASYRGMVRRRALREPVSRILGRREFMGIDFAISPAVLSPRPETEILVETALKILRPQMRGLPRVGAPTKMTPLGGHAPAESVAESEAPTAYQASQSREQRVLDLGTGSGCIAISLLALAPGLQAVAGDVSADALAVAGANAEAAGVAERLTLREGDLFAVCTEGQEEERFDLIASNPPYLVEGDAGIWPEVEKYDPPLALYGGADGLAFYRRIVGDVERYLKPGGALLMEVGAEQAPAVMQMIREQTLLEGIEALVDHAGIERVVVARMAKPE